MDRKTLIREYKRTPQPAGVFRIRNQELGKSLVGASPNVPGMLNRERFQLEMGSHPDNELQDDWSELGPDAFEFETLDLLEPPDDPGQDMSDDLEALRRMWIEKLEETGEVFYAGSKRGT